MALISRRVALAAGATLLSAGAPRNSPAGTRWEYSGTRWDVSGRGLPDVASVLVPVEPPKPPPVGVFLDAEGNEHSFESFRGHGMVVNLWATWCQPCVAEMPSLAALSKALAPFDIAVLPLSSDRGGAKMVASWFESHQVSGLPVLVDPRGALARAWGGDGIPATHVISRDGKERASLEGAADWSSDAAVALIRRLVEG